jgi:hypothetical protein
MPPTGTHLSTQAGTLLLSKVLVQQEYSIVRIMRRHSSLTTANRFHSVSSSRIASSALIYAIFFNDSRHKGHQRPISKLISNAALQG